MSTPSDIEVTRAAPAPSSELVHTLIVHGRALFDAEWRLAKKELGQSAASMTRGLVFAAIAVLLGLVAFHALAVAFVLGLMALGVAGWAAAVITTLVVIGLAAFAAFAAKTQLSAKRLTPERTIAQIKTDYSALKETFRV